MGQGKWTRYWLVFKRPNIFKGGQIMSNTIDCTEKELESLCYIAEFMNVELYAIGTELDNELLRDLQSVIDKLKAVK